MHDTTELKAERFTLPPKDLFREVLTSQSLSLVLKKLYLTKQRQ